MNFLIFLPLPSPPLPELSLERGHPAYLSEGKGARRRRSSGKENKETGGRSKDRSHSFAGGDKKEKKERKYAALERVHSTGGRGEEERRRCEEERRSGEEEKRRRDEEKRRGEDEKRKGEEERRRWEGVVPGAKSILLIEDNLEPLLSPDIIQDLPMEEEDQEGGVEEEHAAR